jgi:sigma-E factor negative regulatory protein RseA
MSEKIKERMSALVDGELEVQSAAETINVLLESDELQLRWSRYHVVRDVLRHKVYPQSGSELRTRVRDRLANEPAHFPPAPLRSRSWRSALKPVAGLALAASVAVVAILAVRSQAPLPGQPQTARAPSPQLAGNLAPAAIPVSVTAQEQLQPLPLKRLQWNTTEPAVANRLNGYLVNHSERLGGPIRGLHPYARIVGYDSAGQR